MFHRLPLRLRLALAFTAAMAVLLGVAALVLVLSLASQLDRGDDRALAARADDVAAFAASSRASATAGPSVQPSEDATGFAQILGPSGEVIATGPSVAGQPVLTPEQLDAALAGGGTLAVDEVPGIEGASRVLARPVDLGGERAVVVVGSSREERDEAVNGLIRLLVIGGPVALALAGGLGYLLAASALRPVEAMRRRGAEISGTEAGVRLPLPDANDELRRLGVTINEMLDRVDGTMGRERELVADASHELRTPLAILRSEIELALTGARSAEELRAALLSASEETDRLERLAEDLLVISRADGGRLPVRAELLDAGGMIERVAERFRERANRDGRSLEVEAPHGLALWADPLRLDQALGNLVDNALRHGDGVVGLAARARGNGEVELIVGDEGVGPPHDIDERVFDRFVRGGESRRRGNGAGLGLPIVRAIAQAHGGRAAVAQTRRGFAVAVRLPAVPQGAATPSGR